MQQTTHGFLPVKKWDDQNVELFKQVKPIKDTSKVRIVQYELNWDFRFSTDACLAKLKSLKVDTALLTKGNCFAFVNRKKNRARLLAFDNKGRPLSLFQAMPKGHSFDLRALKYMPIAFNGPQLEMDIATSRFLEVFFLNKRDQKKLLKTETGSGIFQF